MASKFGKAWKNYHKEIEKHGGGIYFFPNPDESPDKSFITSGVFKLWLDEESPVSKEVRKPKEKKSKQSLASLLIEYARRTGQPRED